jgi:hypothetical protein
MPFPLGVALFGGTLALAKYLSGRARGGATPSGAPPFSYGDDMIAPSGDFILPGPLLFGGLLSPVPTTQKLPTLQKLKPGALLSGPSGVVSYSDGYNPDAYAIAAQEPMQNFGSGDASAAAATASDTGEGTSGGPAGAPAGTPGGEESAAGDTAGGAGGSASGDSGDSGDSGGDAGDAGTW